MDTKPTQSQISSEIQNLVDVTYAKFGGHAYAVGALQQLLSSVLAQLPAHSPLQAESLRIIQNLAIQNKG